MLKRTLQQSQQSDYPSLTDVGNATEGKGDKARNAMYATHANRYVQFRV